MLIKRSAHNTVDYRITKKRNGNGYLSSLSKVFYDTILEVVVLWQRKLNRYPIKQEERNWITC